MMPQRVAILGCGYVGRALGQILLAAGHDVVGTTTNPARAPELSALGIRPALWTAPDTDALRRLLNDRDAVYLTVGAGRHGDYAAVYLGAARALTAAAAGGAVRRVVYTSSTRVYGQDDGSWVDETSPTVATSPEAAVLIETENHLLGESARLGLACTVVRLSGIYGPDREPAERMASVSGRPLAGGQAYVNLIHRDDVVGALAHLLERCYTGVLNLSDDRPTTRREYYDRLLAERGLPAIQWQPAANQGLGKRVRNDLIKRVLDLSLQYPQH